MKENKRDEVDLIEIIFFEYKGKNFSDIIFQKLKGKLKVKLKVKVKVKGKVLVKKWKQFEFDFDNDDDEEMEMDFVKKCKFSIVFQLIFSLFFVWVY